MAAKVADTYVRAGFVTLVQDELLDAGWRIGHRRMWDGNHEEIPDNDDLGYGDLLLACHWPRMLPVEYVERHRFGGLNLHPNLSLGFKVENPVGRALEAKHELMSVACHRMSDDADSGEIVAEHWRTVPFGSTLDYAYELLRPLYASVLKEALSLL